MLNCQTPIKMENKELYDLPQEDEKMNKENTVSENDAETKTVKEDKLEKEIQTTSSDTPLPESINYEILSREEQLKYLKTFIEDTPVSKHNRSVNNLRLAFDKSTKKERDQEKADFLEKGNLIEDFVEVQDDLEKEFYSLYNHFQSLRHKESEDVEKIKEDNLKAKYEVIESIKELLNKQESLNDTFQEFKMLQQKWHDIGQVPQSKLQDIWDNYHHHVENFYNYIKINNELRDIDLKKNLEIKIDLCEKAEALLLDPSPIKAFNALQKLHDIWRETGPVIRDKKEEIWERFRDATLKINQRQNEHYESLRNQMTQNLEAKTELCEKAEEILKQELKTPKEWENKSNELIDLQKIWKTIGFAPKKENNAIYERFRTACDAFFTKKRDFFKDFKEEQNVNFQLKTELCIKAEAMKDSQDWRKTTQEFINIQKEWKKIGPVARKHSDAIWKRFRTACDYFFDQKDEFFKEIDTVQDNNLKLKEKIIERIKNFEIEDKEESVIIEELQDIQKQWSEIGFVPIKDKDRVNQEFRNIINQKFNKLNLNEDEKNLQIYINKLETWKLSNQFEEKIGAERHKMSNRLKQLESEIVVWENNIGFFSKSKKSDALIHNFQKKIDNAKQSIELLAKKLEIIENML